MCRLLESIQLCDGSFYNLEYHERRMVTSLNRLFQFNSAMQLQDRLQSQNYPTAGLYKCRIIYDTNLFEVTYVPYRLVTPQSLRIVESNSIEYEHKYANRVEIEKLFEKRSGCDDVIIAKNGLVTDSSYANILFKQDNCWYTPLKPLLRGTKRSELLDKGLIKEKEIPLQDVTQYESIKLINAMRGFEQEEIDVSNIVF